MAHKKNIVPCVLFAYNRPDMFARTVSAVKAQDVDHVIVFIDGPKNETSVGPVEECKRIAKKIDWAGVDYFFKDKNEGLAGVVDNIHSVFRSYSSAIFLEDDCLPMPGFYSVVKSALRHYERDSRVFSIGGYQQIEDSFFKSYRYSFVSSARFTGWGWATWKDRWDMISSHFSGGGADLRAYRDIPNTAGNDLVLFARDFSRRRKKTWDTSPAWDIKIAILTLYLHKVHLLPTKGFIRNIGLDAGSHFISDQANDIIFNRNIHESTISKITWLNDTSPHDEYNKALKASVDGIREYFLEKAVSAEFKANPMTLSDVIEKTPDILSQIRDNPARTMKKIFFRALWGPINDLSKFWKQYSSDTKE
jgi:hypothetical protein